MAVDLIAATNDANYVRVAAQVGESLVKELNAELEKSASKRNELRATLSYNARSLGRQGDRR